MKISFNVDDVMTQLQLASGVISPKTVIPVLSDLVFKTYNSRSSAIVSASDGDLWSEVKIPLCGDERDADFSFAVNAKDFISALSNLSGMCIDLTIEEGSSVAVASYGSGCFQIPVDNPDDFPSPTVNKDGGFERIVGSQTMLDAIGYTELAVSQDILRPIMTGIHFDFFSDRMVAVALDRIKFVKYTDKSVVSDSEQTVGVTVPMKAARTMSQFMSKFDGDVKMSFNDRMCVISKSEFRIISRLTEGVYPPYDRLLSAGFPISAKVNRSELTNVLKRVLPMANTSSNCVKITLSSGKLVLNTEDLSLSKSANDYAACEYDGDDFCISVKGSALLSVLGNIQCDDVVINVSDRSKPMMLTPAEKDGGIEIVELIMPML